jgi:hypothetical protein
MKSNEGKELRRTAWDVHGAATTEEAKTAQELDTHALRLQSH